MALTGVLLADFSAFVKEATSATTAAKGMEKGAEDAAKKLNGIGGEGFNLKAAVNDPVATATDALKGFGATLGPVAVGTAALAATVVTLGVAMFGLAEHSAEVISGFDDLADKTGMSVPALSRLSNAAHVIGADMGQLTDVVFKLERGIGDNTDAFQKGLGAMGLSTEELKSAGPDRYLELVTEGLKGIADPSTRAAAGTAVLGKGYKDVAAALNDLGEGMRLTADITPFTAQQAADAEKFMFQIASIKTHISALAIAIGGELIGPVSTLVDWMTKLVEVYGKLPEGLRTALTPIKALGAGFDTASAAVAAFTGNTGALPIDLDKATASMTAANDVTQKLKVSVPDLTAALGAQKEMIAVDAAALAEWRTAVEALVGATEGWQTTLDTVDGTVAEAIKFYLSAGVSQADLAKAYGLTAQQVKAVATSLEEYSATLNATADFEKAAADQRAQISRQMTQQINDQIVATLKKKQAEQEANDAFLAAALKDAQAQDAIQQGITDTTATATDGAAKIGEGYDATFARSAAAFESFKGVVVAGTGQMMAAVTDAGSWAERQRHMFEDQMARGTPFVVGGATAMPPMQTRDSGGPVTAGTSYLIGGGREPEIFTPGASGFVTPGGKAGGGGGVSVTNVFNIVDTEAGITRRVSDNITRAIMQAQKL